MKYLEEGEVIDSNTYYLNRLGNWIKAKAIGIKIRYSEFGRYAKME